MLKLKLVHVFGLMAAAAMPLPSAAQDMPGVVTLGTTPPASAGGITAVALASVIGEDAPFSVQVSNFSGTAPYVKLVSSGEIDFGLVTEFEQYVAYEGLEPYDQAYKNLRVIMGGSYYKLSAVAWADSGINSVADIKGKRVSGVYSAHPVCAAIFKILLENAGLTENDVTIVPVTNAASGVEALQAGRVDVAMCSLPTVGVLREMSATRDVRFLKFDDSEAAMEKARAIIPMIGVRTIPAGSELGFLEDQPALVYQFGILTNAATSDAVVRAFIKPVWDHYDKLVEANAAIFNEWDHEAMVGRIRAVPYHPEAIEFYRENGLWTAEMDATQAQLLAQ